MIMIEYLRMTVQNSVKMLNAHDLPVVMQCLQPGRHHWVPPLPFTLRRLAPERS
jgi:hypothetical protein